MHDVNFHNVCFAYWIGTPEMHRDPCYKRANIEVLLRVLSDQKFLKLAIARKKRLKNKSWLGYPVTNLYNALQKKYFKKYVLVVLFSRYNL